MSENPFEIIDPFSKKDKEKERKERKERVNQIKKEVFIDTFLDIIKDKDRKTLLEINQLLLNKLQEFK
tara:strand:- start:1569 stop:1772 length:204 start_codon:yes stop_codon:yes gene_type:complete